MGRPKGSKNKVKSVKHTRAARANGQKGGRPPAALAPELLRKLGPAPINDPIGQARWFSNALTLLTQLRLEGHPNIDSLADQVRKSATAAGKVIPHDIQFEAARVLRSDEDELAADGGPDEEEIAEGPAMSVRAVG
jgi:hypothetical protein